VTYPIGDGRFSNAIYLRIVVKNSGRGPAINPEVFAKALRRMRDLDKTWHAVHEFPPMNLLWANYGKIYFPRIVPKIGKHCDLAHIFDPEYRPKIAGADAPHLGLTGQQTALAFDVMHPPTNQRNIVGPGEYQLDILIAAENCKPVERTVHIFVSGTWINDEEKMLRDGVRARIVLMQLRYALKNILVVSCWPKVSLSPEVFQMKLLHTTMNRSISNPHSGNIYDYPFRRELAGGATGRLVMQ
jgi:hypothetical protein